MQQGADSEAFPWLGDDPTASRGRARRGVQGGDIELTASGIIEKRLIGRAQGAGTAHRPVRVGMEVFPAFLRDPLPTQPDLVLD